MPKILFRGLLPILLLLLAGCATANADQPAAPAYRPPTLAVASPTVFVPTSAPPTPAPTPAVACVDGLTFLEDVTIPDGTEVQPDSTLDKQWRVQNSGTCNWSAGYELRLTNGPDLNATPQQALYPARSGTEAVLHLLFRAPLEPGAYVSEWQAVNPAGEPFGDPFFIQIVVPGQPAETPEPQ